MKMLNYETIMYKGHPVKMVRQYPNDEEVHFTCARCGARYIVNERDTKSYPVSLNEWVLREHECPVCHKKNVGSKWASRTDIPTGYANDW